MAAAGGGSGGGELSLTVLGAWASPFLARVRVALNLKELEYEYVEQDLVNKSELLLASNPVHRKVPVLLHAGKPVCESMLIVQYLDDAFPATGHTFLPADPYRRAVARFWATYIDDHFFVSWFKAFKAATEKERAVATEVALVAVQTLEGAFGEVSEGKGFFGEDRPGYVDIALGGFLGWVGAYAKLAGVNLIDVDQTPLLAAWAERFTAHAAAEGVFPDVDQIVEFAKVLQAQYAIATLPPANE